MILTAEDIGDKHRYIKRNLPEWEKGMGQIKNKGGPWECRNGCVSYLVYRCSICGADMMD